MKHDALSLEERVRLVELVDRVLDRGVVLGGSVTIGVAGVDLIYLELHLLVSSVESLLRRGEGGLLPPATQDADRPESLRSWAGEAGSSDG